MRLRHRRRMLLEGLGRFLCIHRVDRLCGKLQLLRGVGRIDWKTE
jgi:hypothetical protein